LLILRETLETKLILAHSTTKNDTLPRIAYMPKNDTLLKITNFTNENATEPTQIIQIPTIKTIEIILAKVNANN